MQSSDIVLPSVGFVKLATVLKIIPVSRSAWYEGISTGRWPPPVKLSKRSVAWRVEHIRYILDHPEEHWCEINETTLPW